MCYSEKWYDNTGHCLQSLQHVLEYYSETHNDRWFRMRNINTNRMPWDLKLNSSDDQTLEPYLRSNPSHSSVHRCLGSSYSKLTPITMAGAAKVVRSFVYIADKRPILVFENEKDALEFEKIFRGAEIYGQKTHVFLPTPHGLDFVTGGKAGEMAYSK
jgi:hypothetical protein